MTHEEIEDEEFEDDVFEENEFECDGTEIDDDLDYFSAGDPELDADTFDKYNASEDYSTSSDSSSDNFLKTIAISFVKNFFGCK